MPSLASLSGNWSANLADPATTTLTFPVPNPLSGVIVVTARSTVHTTLPAPGPHLAGVRFRVFDDNDVEVGVAASTVLAAPGSHVHVPVVMILPAGLVPGTTAKITIDPDPATAGSGLDTDDTYSIEVLEFE